MYTNKLGARPSQIRAVMAMLCKDRETILSVAVRGEHTCRCSANPAQKGQKMPKFTKAFPFVPSFDLSVVQVKIDFASVSCGDFQYTVS